MGVVCGIVFGIVVPAPAPDLLASTVVSGLVFDLVLMGGSYLNTISSFSRIVLGAAVSGVAESLVALSILTFAGFFGKSAEVLTSAWSIDIILNIALSSGGHYCIQFLEWKKARQPNRKGIACRINELQKRRTARQTAGREAQSKLRSRCLLTISR